VARRTESTREGAATISLADGRYRLGDVIAVGGMATAYVAHDEELDRKVAVKVLDARLAGDEDFRRRFLREARMAAKLTHPNVVQVFDAGEDGSLYIVMEFVEGETLADVLRRRKRLPWREAVELGVQACAALQQAHDGGIVHRDVKPENLLLRSDGTLKITDFGIARAAEETRLTQVGTVLGTAAYLSPEQAAGEEVTAAADIYSLGAVLYELITGRTPYEFDSLAELAEKQQRGPAPLSETAPDVPTHVEDAIMRCLARKPDYRPSSARALAAQLAPGTKEAPTVPLAARRSYRPPRWTLPALAALLIVAAVAMTVALSTGDGGPAATPPRITPPARGATPEQQLRNIADWLRANSR
jgi:eukaryotic-like serine/threonine-protein kinase